MTAQTLSAERVDALFHALADRTRRDIVRRVAVTGLSVSELASDYDMSFAAVQKHVAVLERAGLVSKQRVGRRQVTRVEPEAIRSVRDLLGDLEEQWRGRVERIEDLLAAEANGRAQPEVHGPAAPPETAPGPEQTGPQQTGPEQTGPQQTSLGQTSPQQTGPGQTSPTDTRGPAQPRRTTQRSP